LTAKEQQASSLILVTGV